MFFSTRVQGRERAPVNPSVDSVFIGSGFFLWIISLLPFTALLFSATLFRDFMLVQHYDRRGLYDIGLTKIDEAIEHTPTVIDLYSVKVCLYLCGL